MKRTLLQLLLAAAICLGFGYLVFTSIPEPTPEIELPDIYITQ